MLIERIRQASRSNLAFGICLFILSVEPASAHTAFKSMGGFWSGVLHLLTSLDQVFAIAAIGIVSSLQKRSPHAVILAFLFLGVLLGCFLPYSTFVRLQPGIALPIMMVVLGIVGAFRLQLRSPILAGVAFLGGSLLGIESADGAAETSLPLFALGGSIAGASLLSYIVIATGRLRYGWCLIALRAAASWIAAIGTMMAAFGLKTLSAS